MAQHHRGMADCRSDTSVNEIRAITRSPELVDARRNEIVQAALKLFVAKGYAQTTMSEIAEQCRVSKGSLYNYVGAKKDIVQLILDYTQRVHGQHFGEINSRLSTLSAAEALRQAMRTYLEDVDAMQDAYNFLNHVVVRLERDGRRRMLAASARVTEYFEALLLRGVEAREFEIDNPRLTGHLIARMCSAWAHNRWFLRRLFTLEEFIDQLTAFVLKAVAADRKVPHLRNPEWRR